MRKQKQLCICMLFLACFCLLEGCTRRNSNANHQTQQQNSASTEQLAGDTVTGVISNIDVGTSQISISDVNSGWIYRFGYNAYTSMISRYGEPIAIQQLEIGEIIDVVYNPNQQIALSIQVSYDAWEYEEVTGLTYNQKENHIWVMGEEYTYNASLVLYDKTQEDTTGDAASADAVADDTASGDAVKSQITLSDISDQDTVTCRGYKGKICSVVVNSGHGYVRLSGYSTYIGGMIAIGNVIQPVTKDMVLTVPVGNWTLEIDKDGKMGTKDIVVSQNVEQTVNLANLTIIACRRGIMHFNTTPSNCVITIDGVDYEGRTDFRLEYGTHKVVVGAVGYKSYNGTITLNSAYINVNVELTELEEEESTAQTSSTTEKAKSATTRKQSTTQSSSQTTKETTTASTAEATTAEVAN